MANVLVETQNEESEAAVSPFVPFSVALLELMLVAEFVVGVVEANAIGADAASAKPKVPRVRADIVSVANDFRAICVIVRCIVIFLEYLITN